MKKAALSPDLIRLIFVACALAAVCAPIGGWYLGRSSPMRAYFLAERIWWLWAGGNIGSLIWALIFFRSEPWMARLSLAAVAISLVAAACLPRL